jgi:hypothetical protein
MDDDGVWKSYLDHAQHVLRQEEIKRMQDEFIFSTIRSTILPIRHNDTINRRLSEKYYEKLAKNFKISKNDIHNIKKVENKNEQSKDDNSDSDSESDSDSDSESDSDSDSESDLDSDEGCFDKHGDNKKKGVN